MAKVSLAELHSRVSSSLASTLESDLGAASIPHTAESLEPFVWNVLVNFGVNIKAAEFSETRSRLAREGRLSMDDVRALADEMAQTRSFPKEIDKEAATIALGELLEGYRVPVGRIARLTEKLVRTIVEGLTG